MLQDFKRNSVHYLPLLGIFIMTAVGFAFLPHDRVFQIATAIIVSISYVVWGVVHHKVHDELDILVFIEYVLVASFGLVIVLSLIFRS